MRPIFIDKRAEYRKTVALVLIGLLIILLEWVGLLAGLRSVGEKLWQPLLDKTGQLVWIATAPARSFSKTYKAARRVQELEQRYNEALSELSELEGLRVENQALKILLDNSSLDDQARVVTSPVSSFGTATLNAGRVEGLEEGMLVIGASTLLGRVTEVSQHQSRVSLLTQSQSGPILAQTQEGVQGIVVGDGKRVLLKELPIDAQITVGERVVTTGQAGVEPDIFIGQISDVQSDPTSPVQTAVIEQLVSFYETRVVEVR